VPNHPIVHIEIPASSPAAASTFYQDVFGWKTEVDTAYDYAQFRAEPGPGGGFVSVLAKGSDSPVQYKPDSVLIYIGSEVIDGSLAQVEEHGGKTVLPRTEIPHIGWYAVFADPTGNRIGLFSGPGETGEDVQPHE
jgi:predicted enzyme related to lactoylglutathione lyase